MVTYGKQLLSYNEISSQVLTFIYVFIYYDSPWLGEETTGSISGGHPSQDGVGDVLYVTS